MFDYANYENIERYEKYKLVEIFTWLTLQLRIQNWFKLEISKKKIVSRETILKSGLWFDEKGK